MAAIAEIDYRQLEQNPPGFFGSFFPSEANQGLLDNLRGVRSVSLRTGEFKFNYIRPLWERILPPGVALSRLDSEFEETKAFPGRPELTAAHKAEVVDVFPSLPDSSFGNQEGMWLSIGQDTQVCDSKGKPINKPSPGMTKEEIGDTIKARLCREEPSVFRLRTGLAILGLPNTDQERGVTIGVEHRFKIDPFTPTEIDAYLEEMSLEELQQTSGGFRWPHPLFFPHITEIDGVTRDHPEFMQRTKGLVLSLLGADINTAGLLQFAYARIRQPEKKTLRWERWFALKNGQLVRVRPVDTNDQEELDAISQLVTANFQTHPHYMDLSAEARSVYTQANNPQQTLQVCTDPRNAIAEIVIDSRGQILGYGVTRREGEGVLELRRLHTRQGCEGLGIASYLLDDVVSLAAENGFHIVRVLASGCSDRAFFVRHGFTNNGRGVNQKIHGQHGVEAPVAVCEMEV